MRQVDEDTSYAWKFNYALYISSNTRTKKEGDTLLLYLHGNLIARKTDGVTEINDCGWGTSVTARRLSAITGERVSFSKHDGFCFFRGQPIDNKWIRV